MRKPDIVKAPYDVVDEDFDWAADVPSGTALTAHTFVAAGAGGLAVADSGASGLVTTATISAGLSTYGTVTATADFDNGEKRKRVLTVLIRDL